MQLFNFFQRFFVRFRYPFSLPEDIADSLGISLSNHLAFKDFVFCLTQKMQIPTRLTKFMPRELAEKTFIKPVKTERFCQKTLVSYYFNEGWLEFMLHFDNKARLRRVYLLHIDIPSDQGLEIPLLFESEPILK